MTKPSRYEVGTDNETAQTIRTEAVSGGAEYVADLWVKFKYPIIFERVYYKGGKRVQVIIREVREEHTGKATG